MRTSAAVLAALATAAVIGAVIAYVLLGDSAPEPVTSTPTEEPGVDVAPITAIESQHRSMTVFPFNAFQHDIDELRAVQPRGPEGPTWKDNELEYNIRIVNHKVRCQMDDVPVKDVVDFLKAEYAKVGLVITDFDKPLPDVNVTVMRVEADAFEIIADLQRQTRMLVTYAATEFGTVIGTEGTVQEWYMHTNQRRAEENAAPELADPLLDAKFTIDVEGAHVGAILSKMHADTGVEVICGPKIWNLQKRIDMQYDEPTTLRKALKALARELRGFVRVKDDRVFLIRL